MYVTQTLLNAKMSHKLKLTVKNFTSVTVTSFWLLFECRRVKLSRKHTPVTESHHTKRAGDTAHNLLLDCTDFLLTCTTVYFCIINNYCLQQVILIVFHYAWLVTVKSLFRRNSVYSLRSQLVVKEIMQSWLASELVSFRTNILSLRIMANVLT